MQAHQYYPLDQSLELGWLPPVYVTGEENGHLFSGPSIVMAGKDS